MSHENWHSKMLRSTALPIVGLGGEESADHQVDSLYILELFELNFKQFPDGAYVLRLSFYNFFSRRFCGSFERIPCNCSSTSITFNVTFHFRAFSSHKNAFIVLELAKNDGGAAICWATMPVFEVSRIATHSMPSIGGSQLRQSFPLFAGSCRVLLFADSLPQLVPHLLRFNAVLSASLRLSSESPSFSLPEFLLFSGPSFFKISDDADHSAFSFTSILDNLLLSYGVHSDLSDALILDVISRELCYGRNQTPSKSLHQLRVLERRLKIGTHNGLGFVEEPLSVLLHANLPSSTSASVAASFRHRSQSLGRRDGSIFGSSEFCARNSVRLRHLSAVDPSVAIVFVLEYLIASRTSANDILSDARIVRVGWAAWVPSPGGTVSLADTVTLQLLGGPRPAPFDGFCLRDLSHCAFVRHSPNVKREFPSSFPLSCAKIEIRFNFVPLLESDRIGTLSLLSSQQTPLPQPDLRPRSSAGTHQIEDALPPSCPVVQTKDTLAEGQNFTFEEIDREEEMLSPVNKSGETFAHHRTAATGRFSSVSVLENRQNAIEIELPPARVSPFPRRVLHQFTRFPFPKLIESADFTQIDPMEKRQIRMELERIDKFGANEVSLQFMAFKKLGTVSTIPSSHRLFFTFQFFSFEPITTESLFFCAEDTAINDEEPRVLCRSAGEEKDTPGLIVRFVVGTQKRDFLRYLCEESVHIHIWEADSLFYVGSTSVPLQCLLRQGSAALLSSVQAPVHQNAFPPSVGRNQFVGLLFFRMANVGKNVAKAQIRHRSSMNYGERAQSLKSADGTNALERFLAFQRMDLEQRSLRIFGRGEERRMREWAKLRGRENGHLGQVASEVTAKFLFNEELATFRALRREGKALALLRTVFSSVTTSLRAEAIGGQLVHFQFQLRNPFPEDCICAMEVNDQRLSPVISKKEMEYVRQKEQGKANGRFIFEWEKRTNAWTTILGGMERVEMALRFDTGTAEQGWASITEAKAFFRRLPHGNPLAILELAVFVSRPFLTQHFLWFSDEGQKLIRAVPIGRSPLPKALSVRVSDPSVLCSFQQNHPSADAIQLVRIECLSRGLSDVRDFFVFFYSDPFLSELFAVHRFSVHSIGRLHSAAVQGQQIRVQLGGFGTPPSGELVRLFCSCAEPSSSVGFLPSSSFASSALSLSQMSVHFRPSFLGFCHLLISAVATSTCTMLGQWLLSVRVDEPNIAKVFEVTVPRDSGGVVRKRIPLHNPLGIPRQFRLVSSDHLLLSLPVPLPPPIPPNSSFPLPLLIQTPQTRPCTLQTLLFVEDIQTGAQEGAYAVKMRFE